MPSKSKRDRSNDTNERKNEKSIKLFTLFKTFGNIAFVSEEIEEALELIFMIVDRIVLVSSDSSLSISLVWRFLQLNIDDHDDDDQIMKT